MISKIYVEQWQAKIGWQDFALAEQDLIISRALVDIYSQNNLSSALLFRGGTALNKLFTNSPSRYSEDIDLIHVRDEPIGDLVNEIRKVLDPWLGKPQRNFGEQTVTLNYKFKGEVSGANQKVKIEINNQERVPCFGAINVDFSFDSEWMKGKAVICTYQIEELLGTKYRALYQRKKGRDLFDLWYFDTHGSLDYEKVFKAFKHYLDFQGLNISKKNLIDNLLEKRDSPQFSKDIWKIIHPSIQYKQEQAFERVIAIVSEYMK